MSKLIAKRDFLFSRGGKRVQVTAGKPCPPLGEGRERSALRLGWVEAAPSAESEPPVDDEPPSTPPQGDSGAAEDPPAAGGEAGSGESKADWKQTPIAELDVEQRVRDAVTKAGITTVLELLEYGKEHKSLTKIDGVGESSEKALKQAVQALQEKAAQ